jgi:hypothetical protein
MDDNRWTCSFCHKNYSLKYPYKKHLKKCLVHSSKVEKELDIMVQLKNELKEEFIKMFQITLNEIKLNQTSRCEVSN